MPKLTEFQKTIYPNIASSSVPDLLLSEFLATEDYQISPFSKKFQKLLELPRPLRLEYLTLTPVTTYSYQIWGTSSLWYLIVACSDYNHPHEIPSKTLIYVPTLQSILGVIKTESSNSLAGKVITF